MALRLVKKALFFLAIPLISLVTSNALGQKIYSPDERRHEEARIHKDIEDSLDWHNRSPQTLDDITDNERWLYGRLNESILLRSATGERFGIFESFDENGNKKIFEIRLHRKHKLIERFRPFQGNCDTASIAAEVVSADFVLFREICSSNTRPTGHTLYLYDYASHGMYWLYSGKLASHGKPIMTKRSGIYSLRWTVRLIDSTEDKVAIRNFKISMASPGKWVAKDMESVNEEADSVTPVEKLPIKAEYDLPGFVAGWGKR